MKISSIRKTFRPKASVKARKFISKKISKNVKEGRPLRQSIAIAFSQARKRGFKV